MCLIAFAYKKHPVYRLILAANRDEFLARPTQAAARWGNPDGMVAGKDLQAGGTWMGVDRKGRFGALTNYRERIEEKEAAPSRGKLIVNYMSQDRAPVDYLENLDIISHQYNGFNLLVGDKRDCWWYSNRGGYRQVEPGIYGLSNHLLDTPWPKLNRAKEVMTGIVPSMDIDVNALLDAFKDTSRPPDHELPDTGVGIEWERTLGSMFIEAPKYGTRCTSVILQKYDGNIVFTERTYPTDGSAPFEVVHTID